MSETLQIQVEPDVAICVERWPATVKDAPTVLAIHGFSSNRLIFGGLARAFAGTVELIAVDCRGRGLSSAPADDTRYGMRRHADDAAAVLRALDRKDVIVVGTSMGAWIGTQLAAHHADLVRALILVDGGCLPLLEAGADPVEYVNGVLLGGLDRLDLALPDIETTIAIVRSAPGLNQVWDADVEASAREGFEPSEEGGVRGRMRGFVGVADARSYNDPVAAPYLRSDLSLVTCPTHLITAPDGLPIDHESCSPPVMAPEQVKELATAVPQLTVEETTGTNHFTICIGDISNTYVVAAVRAALG